MSTRDRELAQIIRRLDMMCARGVLRAVVDGGDRQTMQAGLLEGEIADGLERLQTYGLSASPPAGSELFVAFLQGNRDVGHVLGVNHLGSRPRGLNGGETVLYNDKDCTIALSSDGDVVIRGARHVSIEAAENVTISAGQGVTISAGTRIDLIAPGGVFVNGVQIP